MSLSVKTNLYNEYTQNEIQVPDSNYNLTGADLKLSIQHLVVKADSFSVLALSQKVTDWERESEENVNTDLFHSLP